MRERERERAQRKTVHESAQLRHLWPADASMMLLVALLETLLETLLERERLPQSFRPTSCLHDLR
jgi:hypothetical protein